MGREISVEQERTPTHRNSNHSEPTQIFGPRIGLQERHLRRLPTPKAATADQGHQRNRRIAKRDLILETDLEMVHQALHHALQASVDLEQEVIMIPLSKINGGIGARSKTHKHRHSHESHENASTLRET